MKNCGCAKRARKILTVAERKNVPLPKPVRVFLEKKAGEDQPALTTEE